MPQVIIEPNTKQKRTIMYSVEQVQVIGKDKTRNMEEQVVVHKLPYDADSRLGMEKLQRFIKMGYTFEKPGRNTPVINPTPVVEPKMIISEVEIIEEEVPAPLYVSDKPEKPKAKKRKSRTKK